MAEIERQTITYASDEHAQAGNEAMTAQGWRVVEQTKREPRDLPRRFGAEPVILVTYERGD